MTTPTPTLRHPDSGLYQPVERLDSAWAKTRGAIGRGVGEGLWFDYSSSGWRMLHMLGVGEPLVAVFVDGGEVTRRVELRPWVGAAAGRGDDVLELPVGSHLAETIAVGDEVVVG